MDSPGTDVDHRPRSGKVPDRAPSVQRGTRALKGRQVDVPRSPDDDVAAFPELDGNAGLGTHDFHACNFLFEVTGLVKPTLIQ